MVEETYNGIRIGDRVKVIVHKNKLLIGKIGEVRQIASTGNVSVLIDNWGYWVMADCLEKEGGDITKYKKSSSLIEDELDKITTFGGDKLFPSNKEPIIPHTNNEFPPLPLVTSVWQFLDRQPKYKLGQELKSAITNQFVGSPRSILLEYDVDNKIIEVYYRFKENNMIKENELSDDLTVWGRYVKRHIIVEAYQTHFRKELETHNGKVIAEAGDWIIKDIEGMEYPCKKDIFEKTYFETKDKKPSDIALGIFSSFKPKSQEEKELMYNYKFKVDDEVVLNNTLNGTIGKIVSRTIKNNELAYGVLIDNIIRIIIEDQLAIKEDAKTEQLLDKIVEQRNEEIKIHPEDKTLMPVDPILANIKKAEDEHDDQALLNLIGRQDREEKIMEAVEEQTPQEYITSVVPESVLRPVIKNEKETFKFEIGEEVLHNKFGAGKIVDRKIHGMLGGTNFYQYQVEYTDLDAVINKRWAYEEELQDSPF